MGFRKHSVPPDGLTTLARAGSEKFIIRLRTRRLRIVEIGVAIVVIAGVGGGVLVIHLTASAAYAGQISHTSSASAAKSVTTPTPPTPAITQTPGTSPMPMTPQAVTAAPQVLAIGDSIMKGFGLPAAQAWPALLAAQNGWDLTTLACNGAGFRTLGSTQDCGNNFSGVVTTAVALHPDIVLISGSSNDFGENNTALSGSTTTALTRLRAEFPNALIIGISTVWSDTTPPAQLAQINSQVEQAVEQVGGTYLDIGQPLSGHPEWMQADDVHPTAAGQQALDVAIQGAFAAAEQTAQHSTVNSTLAAADGPP